MSDISYDVDPQLKAEFIDDSQDGLREVQGMFVVLESDPSQDEVINTIFRTVHSIKGSAAFFELMKIKTLSHELETIMDLVRREQLSPSRNVINVLLSGVDEMIAMFERVRQGGDEIVDLALFDSLVQKVVGIAEAESVDKQKMWQDLLSRLKSYESAAQIDPAQLAKEMKALFELATRLASASDEVEDLQAPVADKGVDLPASVAALRRILGESPDKALDSENALQVGQLLEEMKPSVEGEQGNVLLASALENYHLFNDSIGMDPIAIKTLIDILDEIVTLAPWKSESLPQAAVETPEEDKPVADKEAKKPAGDSGPKTGKTMRVSEESVDSFLSFVGELVVLGEMYQHIYLKIKENPSLGRFAGEFRKSNEAFDILSTNLQQSILDIRRVPLRLLFQKVPRIIRDVADLKGKEIETRISGETTTVDKSIVDTLEAPLVHIVRNAADHGVEMPDEREKAGKERQGLVTVSVADEADLIFISIKDDGKGLNMDAIASKGVSLGLIEKGRKPTDDEIINLLFTSGVSTADKVTDVSGRGVGMDVVKSNIEAIGGKISVVNRPGEGCEFTIQLPKSISTQIITGFEVVISDRHFILPLEFIVRCFSPEADSIQTAMDSSEFVSLEEGIVDICRLSTVFGSDVDKTKSLYDGVLIVVEDKGSLLALHVDNIEGIKRVVLKNVEGLPKQNDFFAGGAVMGDASVAMVINIESLVSYMISEKAEANS